MNMRRQPATPSPVAGRGLFRPYADSISLTNMRRNELEYVLSTMLDFSKDVSDLNFTVDKPLQVEVSGVLTPVQLNPPIERLTPFQTEMLALNLIGNNQRLIDDLLRTGSCDSSYSLMDGRGSASMCFPSAATTRSCCANSTPGFRPLAI